MAHDEWSWQDEAAAAAAEPDPDYGRDIDDEDDRHAAGYTARTCALTACSRPARPGQRFCSPDHAAGEPHYVDPVDEPHYDEPLYYDEPEYGTPGEWQPGECDICSGGIVDGPLGPILCACAIGQGAPLNQCVCGPDSESVAASSAGGVR